MFAHCKRFEFKRFFRCGIGLTVKKEGRLQVRPAVLPIKSD
jgi:hypothetical protein